MHSTTNLPAVTVLAVDVGGTNTSCAIVTVGGGSFEKRFERRYSTKAEPSLMAPLGRFVDEATALGVPSPGVLCVSGAGPVVGRSITLTNAPWGIDGDDLEARFGVPTFVINDFSAIAWGILLLDPANPGELVQLCLPDGSKAAPSADGPVVVIGAGTGLGFGYVLRDGGMTRVYPSEGGHVCLPVYDDESRAFSFWIEKRYGFAAGAEAGVSGQGIGHIFEFMVSVSTSQSTAVSRILELPGHQRPAGIAEAAAAGDELCSRVMAMFVRLYARVAADAAATFIPTGGIYLAGGIASKNLSFFTEDGRFMECFGHGYRAHIREIAVRTPVFVVRDYDISIYGAANAAATMSADG
ncbi:MAG: glucokinase [Spirochaetae bacterium HGW-Spirochaetae-7]|jgi:glucokinase|nr:MAG: glucokinase [Spirochaetae bacterium HGW-Spirochaetae-7]